MIDVDVKVVQETVNQIRPFLAGKSDAAQGAILADLLAIWLASHMDFKLRKALLAMHVDMVRMLIPANEAIILHVIANAEGAAQ